MHFKKHKILFFSLLVLFLTNDGWSQTPPTLTATGDQYYCPLLQIPIVTAFNIANPDATEINTIYIQISSGYVRGEDTLIYTGSNPNITAPPFISLEGKLTLKWVGSGNAVLSELIAAVKQVVFESSSVNVSGEREFSITIDEKNYLPSTGHYYEYVEAPGITWSEARDAAAALPPYYGVLDPYLVTITSADEAQLSGEQAAGAGWIGASDANFEGTWRWITGPEGMEDGGLGRQFWQGKGIDAGGTTTAPDNFANWNGRIEPNDSGSEDYAHIVTSSSVGLPGTWNDLSITGHQTDITDPYYPRGYIVEYGGMPGNPILNLSASTKISVPEIIAITEDSTCGTGQVTLSANASSGLVIWFDSLSGGTKLGPGDTFTSTISTTTTYYALASSDGICETGKRTAVEATVNAIPTITSAQDITICEGGSGTLNATASSATATINWYDAATGGNLIETGSTIPTPNLTTTTTYYVDATENGCTTASRTPVTVNVQYTNTPTGSATQTFCDIENATVSDLMATGTTIKWYASATGGTPLNSSTVLTTNTTYYASQIINTCESPARLAISVTVFETVTPPVFLVPLVLPECDTNSDGNDTNGFTNFDLTTNETTLLNGKPASEFTFTYFTDASYAPASKITNTTAFENTITNGQTIYVRIENNLDATCKTDTSFDIQVNSLPVIESYIEFKNCDEDGTPDGYTDFNLDEASIIIAKGDASYNVTYYASSTEADLGINPITASPYNNLTANTVYARAENNFGCYRVATVDLLVSTTSFLPGFMENLDSCDDDDIIDGFHLFDLTLASTAIKAEFPLGQNLSVHYFRDLTDARLELNEILPQNAYMSETPFSQTLFVRVESDDNGDCFGIGEHLTLTVFPRPEFEVEPEAIVCLNSPGTILETKYPTDIYTYEWTDESDALISDQPTALVSKGGIYTVVATSGVDCKSFPQTITVAESSIASININDISITDDSNSNNITINTQNLGIGDYQFTLDDSFGYYQHEPLFENVAPGIHTLYIQDKNECGIAKIEVSVIGFPKFFTPNNDGSNDTWQIKGVSADFYPTSLIYIFDRFGKIITQINPTDDGWDGFYNGIMLPSTDYWFSAQLIDENGNIREKSGHFSLIRR